MTPDRLTDKMTDKALAALPAPAVGNRIVYDLQVKGFGLRITAVGARSFILTYRTADRRERRITIGSYPDWSLKAAREQAKALKRRIDQGEDPLAEREADRKAQSVAELWAAFEVDHLPSRRPSTAAEYRRQWTKYLAAPLGKLKIAAVGKEDIAALHRRIAREHPYLANRLLALTSVLFSLAVERKLRTDNPAAGIAKAPEEARETFLSREQIADLDRVLATHPERISAAAIRLMLLTGCRRNEALAAKWSEFDLDNGTWLKPSTNTKSKRPHRIPLSGAAVDILRQCRSRANACGDLACCRHTSSRPSSAAGSD